MTEVQKISRTIRYMTTSQIYKSDSDLIFSRKTANRFRLIFVNYLKSEELKT